MTRSTFGGTANDILVAQAYDGTLRYVTGTLTFWDAATGGAAQVDLVLNSSAATAIPVGADGRIPAFLGPDGATSMWADAGAGAGRVLLPAHSPNISVGTSAPASPVTNDIWIDTN